MPYDLYGQYYASARDAENAELAQCAEIDSRLNQKEIEKLQADQQYNEHYVWEYIQMLEERIKALEEKLTHS